MEKGCEAVGDIKEAIMKLTVIQENQSKHLDRLLDDSTMLVELYEKVNTTRKESESVVLKLDILRNEFHILAENIHTKEASIKDLIFTNRRELDAIGQQRLWKGLSTAILALVFAFGYLYVDIKDLSKNDTIKNNTLILLKANVESMTSSLKEISSSIKRKEYRDMNAEDK